VAARGGDQRAVELERIEMNWYLWTTLSRETFRASNADHLLD